VDPSKELPHPALISGTRNGLALEGAISNYNKMKSVFSQKITTWEIWSGHIKKAHRSEPLSAANCGYMSAVPGAYRRLSESAPRIAMQPPPTD